jgi:hypothetical protein
MPGVFGDPGHAVRCPPEADASSRAGTGCLAGGPLHIRSGRAVGERRQAARRSARSRSTWTLFDQALIGGGVDGAPNNALMTMVLYLYNAAFKQFNFSYAAAIGIILFVVIFTATLVQRRLFGQAPAW